jgi:hypothetical protein
LHASADIAAGEALPPWLGRKGYEDGKGFDIDRIFVTGKFNQMNLGVRESLARAKDAG